MTVQRGTYLCYCKHCDNMYRPVQSLTSSLIRGWSSGKTELLRSVVVLPE